jgi:hypothetical protein
MWTPQQRNWPKLCLGREHMATGNNARQRILDTHCHGRKTSETCVTTGNLARPNYCFSLSFFMWVHRVMRRVIAVYVPLFFTPCSIINSGQKFLVRSGARGQTDSMPGRAERVEGNRAGARPQTVSALGVGDRSSERSGC